MTSIAEIYEAHAPSVYWAAYGITHDRSAALDVMQTVFLRALEREGALLRLADPQVKAWLHTTAKNAGIDHLRKRRREVLLDEPADAVSDDPLPDELAVSKEMRGMVLAAVDTLPEYYRQPILLYYFAGLSQTEIAVYLGEKEATIRSRMMRAKARLYKLLREGGDFCG